MSRNNTTLVQGASTTIYKQVRPGEIVVVQSPQSNTGPIEIGWDDPDTPLAAGQGILLYPGDFHTLPPLPQNAGGNAGVLALDTVGGQTIICQSSS
jgi:hypothetical protein